MSWPDDPTLDCQECGKVLARLTPEQAQRVAEKPYNYVLTCSACQRDIDSDAPIVDVQP